MTFFEKYANSIVNKWLQVFFFSNQRNEPMHIHIEKAEKYAKFWIQPLFVAVNLGFTGKGLREIGEIIDRNESLIRDKWNEHFGKWDSKCTGY